jgi:hypoxanthine phosphoribosyltransferase
MDYFNIVCGIITIISLVITIYYGKKAAILELQKKKLEWPDIQTSANYIGNKIKKDRFTPEIIFTPGLRAASFVWLLEEEFHNTNIPAFIGICSMKNDSIDSSIVTNYQKLETNKWEVLIPKDMLTLNTKKILVVDDLAMSGDFMLAFKKLLIDNGFQQKNIKTATIVVTKVAKANNKCPDYFWMEANDDGFYFPWGKAI